jgi:hypothetical protein
MNEYLNITSFLLGFSLGTTVGVYLLMVTADRVVRHRREQEVSDDN